MQKPTNHDVIVFLIGLACGEIIAIFILQILPNLLPS